MMTEVQHNDLLPRPPTDAEAREVELTCKLRKSEIREGVLADMLRHALNVDEDRLAKVFNAAVAKRMADLKAEVKAT